MQLIAFSNRKHEIGSVSHKGRNRYLTPMNEFFLVLCRMQCGLMELDLASRFGLSQATVSRIVLTWINFLYYKFKETPIWPSRALIDHYMPPSFQQ